MDLYPRRFLQMSLFFLSIGTVLGVAMGVWQRGVPALRYVHIHCMLFGFLTMMVFGVAYHVLPRFTGIAFRHPCAVKLHFYLSNIALLGLLVTYSVKIWYPAGWTAAFIAFAVLAALSMFLFVFNAAPILFARADSEAAPACAHAHPAMRPAPPVPQDAERTAVPAPAYAEVPVAELLQRNPQFGGVLAQFGIDMCCGGRHTLEQVCRKKGIDRDALLRALNGAA